MTHASPGKPGRDSGEKSGEVRALPIFLSDVKARHDARTGCGKPQIPNLKPQTPSPKHQGRAGHDRMVGLVETMITADSLQLTACGPAEDETHVVEDADRSWHQDMGDK
jgi:hypothetical protein